MLFFFFKQKTAYEMRISDWSSDVCSSDLCRWADCCCFPPIIAERSARQDPACCRRLALFCAGRSLQSPAAQHSRSEERRVGKDVSVRVDLGGRRIIKKKNR